MSVNIYDKTEDKLISIAGNTVYADAPVGTISPFGGSDIPSGYLLCDGQAISRTDYAELFAVIGTTFGAGDGSTTFNIPDLRESVPVGSGTRASGVADHDIYTLGQFKDDQLQDHAHTRTPYVNVSNGDYSTAYTHDRQIEQGGTVATGRYGTTTHGKQLGVNYIIKAKQVAIPADFKDAVEDAVAEFALVDTVENGNMKAVTSNAVYDTLNASITDLTADETVVTSDDYTVETLGAHMYQVGMLCWVHIDLMATYTGEVALDTDGHKDFWSNKFSIPDFDDVSEWNAVPCFGYVSNSHRTFEITLNNFGVTGGQKAIAFRLRYSEDEPINTGDVFKLRCVCCFAKA